jgi:hypothetical protein
MREMTMTRTEAIARYAQAEAELMKRPTQENVARANAAYRACLVAAIQKDERREEAHAHSQFGVGA